MVSRESSIRIPGTLCSNYIVTTIKFWSLYKKATVHNFRTVALSDELIFLSHSGLLTGARWFRTESPYRYRADTWNARSFSSFLTPFLWICRGFYRWTLISYRVSMSLSRRYLKRSIIFMTFSPFRQVPVLTDARWFRTGSPYHYRADIWNVRSSSW